MQNQKRNRLAHIILLAACGGLLAVTLLGCGVGHGPYGHMNPGYGYLGSPAYSGGSHNDWRPAPPQYYGPSGMGRKPAYWRDDRYFP